MKIALMIFSQYCITWMEIVGVFKRGVTMTEHGKGLACVDTQYELQGG